MRTVISGRVLSTPGLRELCQERNCWWLTDVIASHIVAGEEFKAARRMDAAPPFLVWVMDRDGEGCVVRCCCDIDGGELIGVVCEQRVPFTDYDFGRYGDRLKLYSGEERLGDGPAWVVYTPEEY